MRVLLDANIVLDVLLDRIPWQEEATAIFEAARQSRLRAAVTSLTLANVYYVARRRVGSQQARNAVADCMESVWVLPVDRSTLEAALASPGPDLEDSIQIAAAEEAQLDAIVTRDPAGFRACPIPVFTPRQLLIKLMEADREGR
jgi:predicted nucleic acid-binding protein